MRFVLFLHKVPITSNQTVIIKCWVDIDKVYGTQQLTSRRLNININCIIFLEIKKNRDSSGAHTSTDLLMIASYKKVYHCYIVSSIYHLKMNFYQHKISPRSLCEDQLYDDPRKYWFSM
eukprot:TRINITY_DN96172_c0_g1_i1.p1 TRINITY_DN96172_c0_g1~~TRINITY_DN96172_c0_g1_i1.p1  ORF type:complete len:119 (+),score=2.21 TRINITY_DN96172_c0_g1_i1:662-1018(+)